MQYSSMNNYYCRKQCVTTFDENQQPGRYLVRGLKEFRTQNDNNSNQCEDSQNECLPSHRGKRK